MKPRRFFTKHRALLCDLARERLRVGLGVGAQPERGALGALPVVQAEIERFERHPAGLRQVGGAALEQHRIADPERPLGSHRDVIGATSASEAACRSYVPRRPSVTSRSNRASRCSPGSARRSNARANRRSGVHASSPVNAAACEPARAAQVR